MPSSPPEEAFHAIAGLYDQALQALEADELETAADLIARAGRALSAPPPGDAAPEARATAQARHRRLMTALSQHRSAVSDRIREVRTGSKALKGYGNRAEPTGRRLLDEA